MKWQLTEGPSTTKLVEATIIANGSDTYGLKERKLNVNLKSFNFRFVTIHSCRVKISYTCLHRFDLLLAEYNSRGEILIEFL